MALYTIADLHLSLGSEKPMDVFGSRWTDHTEKIRIRWSRLVTDEDTVVIPGDSSWASSLEEAEKDLGFIDSLPGKKIIGKGNHDFWWSSMKKMNTFVSEKGFDTISFLYNNAYKVEDHVICGSRGWYVEPSLQTEKEPDYSKIVARERQRLLTSLIRADALDPGGLCERILFLHFPPLFGSFRCEPLLDLIKSSGIKRCYFGHIHGDYSLPHSFGYEGAEYILISSDYLDFVPQRIFG
ncbi:MAG: metallophosphoesterase [Clostridia bacterium]|nr:metallophosphoesterase [Clostridia bacterium]